MRPRRPALGPGSVGELAVADRGYPVLVRPSYVLGGRSMVCYDADALAAVRRPVRDRQEGDRPVLVDRFLEDAVEVDVDALCDATGQVLVCGVMEHIEEAGIHPAARPGAPADHPRGRPGRGRGGGHRPARPHLGVVGSSTSSSPSRAMLYVLEANPRASRSVPFVEKVTGLPVAGERRC